VLLLRASGPTRPAGEIASRVWRQFLFSGTLSETASEQAGISMSLIETLLMRSPGKSWVAISVAVLPD
jgi:hypothetical protein